MVPERSGWSRARRWLPPPTAGKSCAVHRVRRGILACGSVPACLCESPHQASEGGGAFRTNRTARAPCAAAVCVRNGDAVRTHPMGGASRSTAAHGSRRPPLTAFVPVKATGNHPSDTKERASSASAAPASLLLSPARGLEWRESHLCLSRCLCYAHWRREIISSSNGG